MATKKFQSIGSVAHLDTKIRLVLVPIIDLLQRRLLIKGPDKMVSQAQLVELGLVSQEQLDNLETE